MQMMTLSRPQVGEVSDALVRADFLRWDVGESCALHFHREAGEMFVFLEGACDIEVDGTLYRCGPGEAVYVEPEERHRLTAVGQQPLAFFLAVFPNLTPRTTWVCDDGRLEDEA